MIGAGEAAVAEAIRGRIDADEHLVEADPQLMLLHEQGGGVAGGRVAIPQLAALARLALRLQVEVTRPVTAGAEDADVDLMVRAIPDDDSVAIEIISWSVRPVQPAPGARFLRRDQDFIRASADFVWSIDDDLILTGISEQAAAALSSTVTAAIGQPFDRLFKLLPGEDGEPMVAAIAERRRFERQLVELRGTDLGVLTLSGEPQFDRSGHFVGYKGTATRVPPAPSRPGVTPQVNADEDFGTEIGRVLRAPLERIIENAEDIHALSYGPLKRGYVEYAGDIAAAGRHLMSLLDDLVELQAVEKADFRIASDAVDLGEAARRAAGLLAGRAAEKNVRIERPGEFEKFFVTGEFRRVLQILVNLLGNAVRYSPPGSTIWLRGRMEAGNAVMIVADQGKGLAPDHHERIFEKFERLDRGEAGGSGLGLYISRRLARAMGGDILVDSAPGEGARFILTLPARR